MHDWKTQTQNFFLRGKNKNARWRSGLLDHFPQCLDWKRTWSAKVRSPQWSRGTYSGGGGGGPLGSPNILTRKHKCLYEQLITYISTQKAVNVDHPYTDGSNALRVVTSTLPGLLLLPALKPAEKLLQKRLNSVCRLPKSPCLFFLIQLNSSIYPWFPDSSARQPQSQGKVFDKSFAPNIPTLESLYEQIPPPPPNVAFASCVESAVRTRAGRVEIRHIPVVYHLP